MIQTLFYVWMFILGLVWGSFLNVLIARLNQEKGIWLGRSHCFACKKNLAWYELIPLISFLIQSGRCRHCQRQIPWRYPVIELAVGLAFLLTSLTLNSEISSELFLIKLAIVFVLTALAFFDAIYFILPDKLTGFLVVLAVIHGWLGGLGLWPNMFISAVGAGGFFAIIHLASEGKWMGLGDAKLAFGLGLALGYPFIFWSIAVSVWIASIVGLLLVGLGRAGLKSPLPFGTFLSAVGIVFFLFGYEIQNNFAFIERIF